MAPDGSALPPNTPGDPAAALSQVFHRLNNQLGVVLANAELLEARLTDDTQRARASQVVSGALEAIAAVQDLRRLVGALPPPSTSFPTTRPSA